MISLQNNLKMLSAAAALLAALTAAAASSSSSSVYPTRGYATDAFEGFEAYDLDERVPQKEDSIWFSLHRDNAPAQLAFARAERKRGNLNHSRKNYEALIREWPTSPEAPVAQFELAQLQETRGKFDKAFEEYQYLIIHYSGHFNYPQVLEAQFRLANLLKDDNKSMFGWILSGNDTIRERFEVIVRNAPRSPLAPRCMFIVGNIRVDDNELDDAVKVFDGLLNRYPYSPEAGDAAYTSAQCRYKLATKNRANEDLCRNAIAFTRSVLTRMPSHPKRIQMNVWLRELEDLLVEQNYRNACFYDSPRKNVSTAKAAYRRFLAEFGSSKYADEVRARLAKLENAGHVRAAADVK